MSKKPLHSRLETLFAELAGEGQSPAQPAQEPAEKPRRPARESVARPRHAVVEPMPEIPASVAQRGVALQNQTIQPAQEIWTETGKQTFTANSIRFTDAIDSEPAVAAVPLRMQGVGDLLLEIVDDTGQRAWSEDDRFLLMEVSAQLALALDNAQLYRSVQQELAERIRAEKETLRRNKGLAALNKIGQQLSRLASRKEIFQLLAMMVGEVLDTDNLYICTYSAKDQTLSYPVYHKSGQPVDVPARPYASGIVESVLTAREPLFVPAHVAEVLRAACIPIPEPTPACFLAVPMLTGDRPIGAIVVQNFIEEDVYDQLDAELLSTAAAQTATALENADLFEQMQAAMQAIETRERYQAAVARSAAMLTESGTQAIPDVLKTLGQAAQCSRVTFHRIVENAAPSGWKTSAEWADDGTMIPSTAWQIDALLASGDTPWVADLRAQGWSVRQSAPAGAAAPSTILILAVPEEGAQPGLLVFEQTARSRAWMRDEVNSLRVAADAIRNTFVREELLHKLQANLEETENLYQASNNLALANELQDMVQAVVTGVRGPEINRALLVLFAYDRYDRLSQMTVTANWYSGRGAPPEQVGTEFLHSGFERLFVSQTPVFIDDVRDSNIDLDLRETLLNQRSRALAVLPLLSSKRQTGVLVLQSETQHAFHGREKRTYPPLVDQMAIAVENQRLFEQTEKALAETGLLYNVSNRIAQAGGPQDMLALIVDSILPTGADRATLLLLEHDASGEPVHIEVVGTQERGGAYRILGTQLVANTMPLVHRLRGEPVLINNLDTDPLDEDTRKTLKHLGLGSCCLVPLRTSGSLIGVLITSSRHAGAYTQQEVNLLRIAGNGIAVALEKQRLLRQAQRRALELQTASEIARDTASTLSLDLLLERIVNMVAERFGYYHVALFLLEESKTYALIREATGSAGQQIKQQGLRLQVGSSSVVGTAAATAQPFLLNDITQQSIYAPHILLSETRSEMGIPLMLNDSVIGVLDIQSQMPNAFHQDDVTVLTVLADQIAIAIENAQAYELSQKAIADMQEIDRVKSQFLANMSHELRTPLNSIIGFSRVILKGIDGPINDLQQQDMTAIYQSGQHLLGLINDILDLSRIEAGKMELAFTDLSMVDLINSTMPTVAGLIKDKPIRLNTILPENLPSVRADQMRVRQVLVNFLSNAAKFTDEGTITVEASTIVGPAGQPELMVTVTDSGPGIAKVDHEKLFLPFSQVDDSPTRKTGGSGLGLSICRSLIEMHNGRIGLLRSEIGAGSTFFFALPVEVSGDEAVSASGEEANLILAIDDDPKITGLYERYLKPYGYQVIPLNSPAQALRTVQERKPMAVTLDIMMPGKDGWQILQELKNCPETSSIPVIICSILENQEKGFSLGAADYLVKPFLQEDMLGALSRLNGSGETHKVLVIDDDRVEMQAITRMIEDHEQGPHFQVSTALGGIEGWTAIQAQQPEIILLDLFMPEMNGFQILEHLQESDTLRDIPVILLADTELTPEQQQQVTEFGQGIFTKSLLHASELLETVANTLGKYRSRQQPV